MYKHMQSYTIIYTHAQSYTIIYNRIQSYTIIYNHIQSYTNIYNHSRYTIIYNYLKKRNIVIPPRERSNKSEKYEGAYVKEPIPGKYDWVVSFDLNSLYPHLIMQYNIHPKLYLIQDIHIRE